MAKQKGSMKCIVERLMFPRLQQVHLKNLGWENHPHVAQNVG